MASDDQKFLPISDSMGRDLDSGRAIGRDVADFLPDSVLQELYDASHPGPVHAENLVPISPAAAKEMRTQTGDTLPKMPATRRVIPAPYKRDRITGGRHGKKWTTCAAQDIHPGDIITGIGLIVRVERRVVYATREQVAQGMANSATLLGVPGFPVPGHDPDDLVAVGEATLVLGAGGNTARYRAAEEVKVFR